MGLERAREERAERERKKKKNERDRERGRKEKREMPQVSALRIIWEQGKIARRRHRFSGSLRFSWGEG
jgi:hypothetical protein